MALYFSAATDEQRNGIKTVCVIRMANLIQRSTAKRDAEEARGV